MIIISGASRGIGRYLLNELVAKGEDVLGLYNQTQPAQYADKYHRVDLSKELEVQEFVKTVSGSLKNTVLINAAGISYNAFAHKADSPSWKNVIDVNLTGTFYLIKELLPYMRNDGYGRIVNFGSVVAQQGVLGTSAYAASKAALWGMTKSIAAENGGKNITINTINPGYFNIGMIDEVPEKMLAGIIDRIPARRLGEPSEILSTVQYIVQTPYLNGCCIDLNGGLF